MTRVALYARYSSERQNERSIEDQFAVLTRHAEARGWSVVLTYCDAAISGAAMANRPGLNAALQAAQARGYDVLLAEDEDRIARNLEHQAHVFNRLTQLGVAIATLSTDRIGLMEVAFKGLMGQQYLEVLSQKTKRGMHANAQKGLATGSRIYGYRSSPGGGQEIVPEEAEVVRRVWREYGLDLRSGREIAAGLNGDRVPGPRGGWWNASTLLGNAGRGNGVLKCELYAGVKVWNRVEMTKDLATGARISRARPPSEWKRVAVPHLAIVPPDVAEAVRRRFEAQAGRKPVELRRRPGLFSGLLRCRCGAAYTVISGDRLGCAARREKGATVCANGRIVSRAEIEARAIEGLRTKLLSPEAVRAFIEEYREHRARLKTEAADRRRPLDRKLAELNRRLDRAVDQLLDSDAPAATLKAKVKALEAERDEVVAALAACDADLSDSPVELHPHAPRRWAETVEQLHAVLNAASSSPETVERAQLDRLRALIDRIEIVPLGPQRGAPVEVTLFGRLAGILESERLGTESRSKVVAGGGIGLRPTSPAPSPLRIPLRRLA